MAVVCRNGKPALWVWLLGMVTLLQSTSSQSLYDQAFKKVGDSCAVDTECHDNMVCVTDRAIPNSNLACACDKGYVIKSDLTCGLPEGSWCPWTAGAHCGNKMVCTAYKCTCVSGAMGKADGSCGMKHGDTCSVARDCGDHMVCDAGKCSCDVTYAVTSHLTCEIPCVATEYCKPYGGCFYDDPLNPTRQTCYCQSGWAGIACQFGTVVYNIYVTTGNNDHAGSDSELNIAIFGLNGTTGRMLLSYSTNNRQYVLDKGDVDHFAVTAQGVGEITHVTLAYHNIYTYIRDRWFPLYLSISKEGDDRVYTFVFDTWVYMHTYLTLSDPCVMSSCADVTNCTHVGLTSHTYHCTCDSTKTSPICWTDYRCSYEACVWDLLVADYRCSYGDATGTRIWEWGRYYRCSYGDALYEADGPVDGAMECSDSEGAHVAIVQSVQQLDNVTQCVCQGDVSGFYVYLWQDTEGLTTASPQSTTPSADDPNACTAVDNAHCEKVGMHYCYMREDWARKYCHTKCGYCNDHWVVAGKHRYRRVTQDRFYNASILPELEVFCLDYEVHLYEVACWEPNTYARPALCQRGPDLSGLRTCPTLPTTTVEEVTTETPPEPSTAPTTETPTTTTTTPTTTTTTPTTTTTTPTTTTTTPTTTTTTTPAINPYTGSCKLVCEADTTPSMTSEEVSTSMTSEPPTTTTPLEPETSPAPSTANSSSRCFNFTGPQIPEGMTLEEFKAMLVAEIKLLLLLKPSTLGKAKAKKASAADERPSSQTAGIMAVGIIVCVGVLMLMSDLTSLVIWWKGRSPRVESEWEGEGGETDVSSA